MTPEENQQYKILVVEDDPAIAELLTEQLVEAGYSVEVVDNAQCALEALCNNSVTCVLLDRMLHGDMDGGMNVLRAMKSDAIGVDLKHVPVIIQSARVEQADIMLGIREGARYYLRKPYEEAEMLIVVNSAISEYKQQKMLLAKIKELHATSLYTPPWSLMEGTFSFKTITDGDLLAQQLSGLCEGDVSIITTALTELTRNAVEHGNLCIGCDEKTVLVSNGTWNSEIERRLCLPENSNKSVLVKCSTLEDGVFQILIKDCGAGFDYEKYLEMDPARLLQPSGKGVAVAHAFSGGLEYSENGSCVVVRFKKRKRS